VSSKIKFEGSLPLPGQNHDKQMDIARQMCERFHGVIQEFENATQHTQPLIEKVCLLVESDELSLGKQYRQQGVVENFGPIVICRVRILQLMQAIEAKSSKSISSIVERLSETNRRTLSDKLFLKIESPDFADALSRLKNECKPYGKLHLSRIEDACLVEGFREFETPSALLASDAVILAWINQLAPETVDDNANLLPLNSLMICCRLIRAGILPDNENTKQLVKQSLTRLEHRKGPELPIVYAEISELAKNSSREFRVEVIVSSQKERINGTLRISGADVKNGFLFGTLEDGVFSKNPIFWK
jgi:hypothetical protein